MSKIIAKECLDPGGLIVESGLMLARTVTARLSASDAVEISMEGMRGLSSSYFNAFFSELVEKFDLTTIENRVTFAFSTNAQESIYRRSLESFKKAVV